MPEQNTSQNAFSAMIRRLFSLDDERSLWVEESTLGAETTLVHRGKHVSVKIPESMNNTVTLRLRGLGKTRFGRTGDLFLHVWLNQGADVDRVLWLSASAARRGAEKVLNTGEKRVTVVVPKDSRDGLILRLRGLGRGPHTGEHAPPLKRANRGDLRVKLAVFPDTITPTYGDFDALSTENMALEGWVYRHYDEVLAKLGQAALPSAALPAEAVTDAFNTWGYRGIFDALVKHMGLAGASITLKPSPTLAVPGTCERTRFVQSNQVTGATYGITLHQQFLDNPFTIAAILAHELCHVIFYQQLDTTAGVAGHVLQNQKATLEMERTVDLLVFMFRLGEFQLRVARDTRLTLGYFDQGLFERMQVIVSRKLERQ